MIDQGGDDIRFFHEGYNQKTNCLGGSHTK